MDYYQDYYKKVTLFLEEYLFFSSDNYTPNGELYLTAIRKGVSLLLKEKVFISKKKIKQQALRKYAIILKDDFFEKEG